MLVSVKNLRSTCTQLIEATRWTRAELGNKIGVHEETVRRWEAIENDEEIQRVQEPPVIKLTTVFKQVTGQPAPLQRI